MKLICKTQYPEITVAGLGKFKAGDEIGDGTRFLVTDSLGSQLLLGGEWDAVGVPCEDAEPVGLSVPHKRKLK